MRGRAAEAARAPAAPAAAVRSARRLRGAAASSAIWSGPPGYPWTCRRSTRPTMPAAWHVGVWPASQRRRLSASSGGTDGLSPEHAPPPYRCQTAPASCPARSAVPMEYPSSRMVLAHDPDRATASDGPLGPDRSEALRRIASVVSGQRDLAHLFADVIDESFSLFRVDQAGLWTYRDAEQPLTHRRPSRPVERDPRPGRHADPRRDDRRDDGHPRAARPGHGRRPVVHAAGAPRHLPARRHPDHLLRPGRVRAASRSACSSSTTTSRTPGPPSETGAGPRVRRPDGDGHRQRPA